MNLPDKNKEKMCLVSYFQFLIKKIPHALAPTLVSPQQKTIYIIPTDPDPATFIFP